MEKFVHKYFKLKVEHLNNIVLDLSSLKNINSCKSYLTLLTNIRWSDIDCNKSVYRSSNNLVLPVDETISINPLFINILIQTLLK